MNPLLDILRAAAERHATAALPFGVRQPLNWIAEVETPEAAAGLMVDAIVAAEAAETAAKTAAADLRERLAMVLQELPSKTVIRGAHHTASLTHGRPAVVITDPGLIPEAFTRTPPPVPDKTKIKAALDAGETVPGAAMSNAGAMPVLRIASNRSAAA